MARFLTLFSQLMPLWVVALGLVGYVRPGAFAPVAPFLPWFFMGTMVGVGALLDVSAFAPGTALPSALFASWCVVTASALAAFWRWRARASDMG